MNSLQASVTQLKESSMVSEDEYRQAVTFMTEEFRVLRPKNGAGKDHSPNVFRR
jgi:hypothetical protein